MGWSLFPLRLEAIPIISFLIDPNLYSLIAMGMTIVFCFFLVHFLGLGSAGPTDPLGDL